MQMEYTNYLTTPSGRYCQVRDITNAQYLLLVKFLQAENYKKFFQCLDEIVKKSIPDIDDFDIIQRCYVYIAMCMYSIRGNISVNNTMIGTQQIPIATILNNIESSYAVNFVAQYQLKQGVVLKFGYPKKFTYEGQTPSIDYYSGIIGCNDIVFTDQQKQILKQKLGTKQLSFIDDFLRQKTVSVCDLFQGVPMNKFQMNIGNQSIIANVVGFYNMPLQVFYKVLYTMMKHVRMSYSDFLKISYVQTEILLKNAVQQNSKMNQQAKNGNIGVLERQLND